MPAFLTWLDGHRPWRVLDRPLFVIGAPRSGTTLLYDLVRRHPRLRSWPFEAEAAWNRAQPADHPATLGVAWPLEYATEDRRRRLARELYTGMLPRRRAQGDPVGRLERLALRRIRFVEKTPANCFRVDAIAALFPDARFVFLHRDAPANIASILEAWERAPDLARVQLPHPSGSGTVSWTFVLPPGWEPYVERPVPERAAFQWAASNAAALASFERLDPARYVTVRYDELVVDPGSVATRVLAVTELPPSPEVDAHARDLPVSRTALSAPDPDKWRSRAEAIEPLLAGLDGLRARLGYDVHPRGGTAP